MTIYFTASIFQKDIYGENYDKIVASLHELGHKVIHEHITAVTLDDKRMYSEDKRKSHYKQVIKWITDADIVVAEVSYPSTINVGHEVSLALEKGKPVIGMYCKDKQSTFFEGIHSDKFIYEEYEDNNVKEILQSALQYAQDQSDTRFNFFISPRHVTYLDEISKKRRIPKSVYLRQLIEQDRAANEEYSQS